MAFNTRMAHNTEPTLLKPTESGRILRYRIKGKTPPVDQQQYVPVLLDLPRHSFSISFSSSHLQPSLECIPVSCPPIHRPVRSHLFSLIIGWLVAGPYNVVMDATLQFVYCSHGRLGIQYNTITRDLTKKNISLHFHIM